MEKQNVYLSEKVLWDMVHDIKVNSPNDADLGRKVREFVNKFYVPESNHI